MGIVDTHSKTFLTRDESHTLTDASMLVCTAAASGNVPPMTSLPVTTSGSHPTWDKTQSSGRRAMWRSKQGSPLEMAIRAAGLLRWACLTAGRLYYKNDSSGGWGRIDQGIEPSSSDSSSWRSAVGFGAATYLHTSCVTHLVLSV